MMRSVFALTALACVPAVAAWAAAAGSERVLQTFDAYNYQVPTASGCFPYAGLLSARGGSVFYGVASECGIRADGVAGNGTLFEIRRSGTGTTYSVLHTFSQSTDGGNPSTTPVTDGTSLYGTASIGGSTGNGTVYQFTPNASGSGYTVLYSFTGGADGAQPNGALVRGANGTLYGTTSYGGAGAFPSGGGTVYSLRPPGTGQSGWTFAVLHMFAGTDGIRPLAGLVADAAGSLYGATSTGGVNDGGTAFALSPPAVVGGSWGYQVIVPFSYAPNATTGPSNVEAPLIFDHKGNLYGTSGSGGGTAQKNYGTVFELSPPAVTGAAWTTTVLAAFDRTNGSGPAAPLLMSVSGTLYGTTETGGASGRGTAFMLTPPAMPGGAWQQTTLRNFACGGANAGGGDPTAGFDFAANGQLISTTSVCGTTNAGVIYLLTP